MFDRSGTLADVAVIESVDAEKSLELVKKEEGKLCTVKELSTTYKGVYCAGTLQWQATNYHTPEDALYDAELDAEEVPSPLSSTQKLIWDRADVYVLGKC